MNIGELDQAKEAMKDIASVIRTHYMEMIKAGFTPQEALQLTVGFQRDLIAGNK